MIYKNRVSIVNVLHACWSKARFFEGAPAVPGQTSQTNQSATPDYSDYVSEFVSSVDGLALIQAFRRIKDAKLRHRLVLLVEQVTAEE